MYIDLFLYSLSSKFNNGKINLLMRIKLFEIKKEFIFLYLSHKKKFFSNIKYDILFKLFFTPFKIKYSAPSASIFNKLFFKFTLFSIKTWSKDLVCKFI
jgi:hypothetical protein